MRCCPKGLLCVVGVLLALAATTSGARAATPPSYLALGDSLAAGDQPDRSGRDRPTNQGYADVVARRLASAHPGLVAVKLSCGYATTQSLLSGRGCLGASLGPGSQVDQAERFLRAHPRRVPLVTVNIGDNDVERCFAADGTVDQGCVARGRAAISRNLPTIAARLRAAAGRGTRIVGVVDYDQFLALWLRGRAGRTAARRSVRVVGDLNALVAGLWRRGGVAVADAGARFATQDLTTQRRLAGHGTVPLAVYRVCRWTWACGGSPGGFDDHANAAGYAQIAQAVLDALPAGG